LVQPGNGGLVASYSQFLLLPQMPQSPQKCSNVTVVILELKNSFEKPGLAERSS